MLFRFTLPYLSNLHPHPNIQSLHLRVEHTDAGAPAEMDRGQQAEGKGWPDMDSPPAALPLPALQKIRLVLYSDDALNTSNQHEAERFARDWLPFTMKKGKLSVIRELKDEAD